MTYHTPLFVVSSILYFIFVLSVYFGLARVRKGKSATRPFVSIIIAARNEEQTLPHLLPALIKQDYTDGNFEIIIVNDRSEDSTPDVVLTFDSGDIPLTLINLTETPKGFSPKKYALTKGIEAAKGELICATDADCVPPPTWVSSVVSHFDETTGMVIGFSPLIVEGGGKFFREYLALDALALAVVSAGGAGWQMGWTAAGRNIAYRRSVFYEVGGYEDVKGQISGDDDLLMHMVQQKTNWRLKYAAGVESNIPSFLQPGVKSYVNQRTRHASKFRAFPLRVKAAALAIFIFYALLFLLPVYMLIEGRYIWGYETIVILKFLIEYATVKRGAQKLEDKFSFGMFLRAFFLHPLLIVFFSIRGARGKFTWKDRPYTQK